MNGASFSRKRGQAVQIPLAQRARLATLAQSRIEAGDHIPDNPPLEDEQLRRMALARAVRLAREKTGLSQSQLRPDTGSGLAGCATTSRRGLRPTCL